ncbi:MAG: nuclear transport factor 2 family protein [Pseudomonadota bacterium]
MNSERDQVCESIYRYGLGIDTRDWQLYRSIFTDAIDMDFSSYSGQPGGRMSADEWVNGCKILFMGLDATQHTMTNPIVDIAGDRATCKMYMQAAHFLKNDMGDDEFTLGGYYDDRLIRTADGWQIEAVTLTVLWNRGNRHIMELAAGIGAKRLSA